MGDKSPKSKQRGADQKAAGKKNKASKAKAKQDAQRPVMPTKGK